VVTEGNGDRRGQAFFRAPELFIAKIRTLREEVARLRDDLAAAEAENRTLRAQVADLKAQLG
jgi:ribosomal protein L19E